MSREKILHRVRTALGRSSGDAPAGLPPVRLHIAPMEREERIQTMLLRVRALGGEGVRTTDPLPVVAETLAGKTAVASNSRFLAECGVTGLAGVRSGITGSRELRDICALADVGITSADYALADTGTLVMLSTPEEARLISLLPPMHLAVVPADRILSGLDELFTILPDPARVASSMVLITGPSRTADIELVLVRGVHGPGKITLVVVE